MNVQQIYNQYQIPPNLQKHMLRVTGVSQIILENWQGVHLDKNSIVNACLFHDMANIIKFKFTKPYLFKEEEKQVEHWKKIHLEYIKKYGNDVHKATLIIGKEIGLSVKILNIIENIEWDYTQKLMEEKNFESLIPIYCDMRIGPFGIMTLEKRINNLKTRNHAHNFDDLIKSAILLEEILQKKITINLNDINDKQINERFNILLKL